MEWSLLIYPASALFVYMSALFVVAVVKRDNSIADIGYGIGFIIAVTPPALDSLASHGGWVLVGLVWIWGLRLSLRIAAKNRGKPEDFRYQKWRAEWTYFYLRSFFQVFMLQGGIIFVIALPVLLTLLGGTDIRTLAGFVGFALWVTGFFFETVSDSQLDRFLADPASRGRLMQTGLWRYSRHPNYFGESLMWWGIALAAQGALPLALAPLIWTSPLLITWLLLRVSGIPLLEARLRQHPEWADYAARTNAFFPWRPGAGHSEK